MHVSSSKHSYAWLPTWKKCDYRTDRHTHTHRQTDTGQRDPYVPLCFGGDTTTDTQSAKIVSEYTICIRVFEKNFWEVPCPAPLSQLQEVIPPTPSHRSLQSWSSIPSGSGPSFWIRHWQYKVYFSAILLKIQLNFSGFKWLYLNPRLCHFVSFFFQIFSGGGRTNRRRHHSRTFSHRASRTPNLSSGSASLWSSIFVWQSGLGLDFYPLATALEGI